MKNKWMHLGYQWNVKLTTGTWEGTDVEEVGVDESGSGSVVDVLLAGDVADVADVALLDCGAVTASKPGIDESWNNYAMCQSFKTP